MKHTRYETQTIFSTFESMMENHNHRMPLTGRAITTPNQARICHSGPKSKAQ